jgi:hypothetical protein
MTDQPDALESIADSLNSISASLQVIAEALASSAPWNVTIKP